MGAEKTLGKRNAAMLNTEMRLGALGANFRLKDGARQSGRRGCFFAAFEGLLLCISAFRLNFIVRNVFYCIPICQESGWNFNA